MSTNPNNAVGTNGAYGGRTSVKAFNDILSALSGRGVLSGWAVSPDTGMTLSVGGVAGTRDVAIGEDNNGNRTTINNISEVPISVDIPAAPASNSRIDSIVLYVDNPPQGTTNAVDNPAACGLIVVSSDIAGSPTPPSDTAVRTAITADGASGSTAFFCVVADVRVAAGTTNITANMITMKEKTSAGVAEVDTDSIVDGAVTNPKLANGAVKSQNIDYPSLQLPENNGWSGYIGNDGKIHRYRVYSGTAGPVAVNQSAIAVNNIPFPTDLGTPATDFGIYSFAYGCDWGESYMKLPWLFDGLSNLSVTVHNSYTQPRQTVRYWCRIELVEL